MHMVFLKEINLSCSAGTLHTFFHAYVYFPEKNYVGLNFHGPVKNG